MRASIFADAGFPDGLLRTVLISGGADTERLIDDERIETYVTERVDGIHITTHCSSWRSFGWCWIQHRRSPCLWPCWCGVSLVTPNELEAEVLTGIVVTSHHSAVRAARWFLDRGVTIAVITRGEHGVLVMGREGAQEYPALTVTPEDTMAAGDAFTGALGASLAGGASLPDALRRGLAAGALAVTVRGANQSLPTAAAIDTFLAAQA